MKNIIYVYALLDEHDYIRYIGKSKTPHKRFHAHITESKKFNKTHKNKWINSMLNKGLKPSLYILYLCDGEERANNLEIELIAHYKKYVKLTNGTDGGDGRLGLKMLQETKDKLSQTMKGRKPTKETIDKIKKARSFPVLQYNMNGEFIKEWSGCREVARQFNTNSATVSRACRGITSCKINTITTTKGFVWKYKTNNFKNKIEPVIKYKPTGKKHKIINQYDLNNNFIKEWESTKEAANALNICTTTLCKCVNGITKTSAGYKWKYKEEVENV